MAKESGDQARPAPIVDQGTRPGAIVRLLIFTLVLILSAAAFVLFRTAILVPNMFLPYSFAAPSWRPGFKPLKALASYASALGYVWGWYADRH